MGITYGCLFDLLYKDGIESLLITITSILMKYDKFKKIPKILLNISFLELAEEFPRDSKTSSN